MTSVAVERELLALRGVNLELLIVDDGSGSDETLYALNTLGLNRPWLRVVRLQTNNGGAHARNVGVKLSHGEWIAFLDSDDVWIRGSVVRLHDALSASPAIDWISGDYLYQLDGVKVASEPHRKTRSSPEGIVGAAYSAGDVRVREQPVSLFLDSALCSMGSCLIRRVTFDQVGGFDEAVRKGDDTELYWRLARVATFAFAPWPVLVYRRNAGGVSHDGGPLTDWEPAVLRQMISLPQWQPHLPQLRHRLMGSLESNIVHYRRQRQRAKALKAILTSLSLDPVRGRTWRHLVAVLTFG